MISLEVLSFMKLFSWKSGKGIQGGGPQHSNPILVPSDLHYKRIFKLKAEISYPTIKQEMDLILVSIKKNLNQFCIKLSKYVL